MIAWNQFMFSNLPYGDARVQVLGENRKRVGLIFEAHDPGGAEVYLYPNPGLARVDFAHWVLPSNPLNPKAVLSILGADVCPKGSVYAGAAEVTAKLHIIELMEDS